MTTFFVIVLESWWPFLAIIKHFHALPAFQMILSPAVPFVKFNHIFTFIRCHSLYSVTRGGLAVCPPPSDATTLCLWSGLSEWLFFTLYLRVWFLFFDGRQIDLVRTDIIWPRRVTALLCTNTRTHQITTSDSKEENFEGRRLHAVKSYPECSGYVGQTSADVFQVAIQQI